MKRTHTYQENIVAYICMLIRDDNQEEQPFSDALYCYDLVYELACDLADDFIGSEWDDAGKPLFDCVVKYLHSEEAERMISDYNYKENTDNQI